MLEKKEHSSEEEQQAFQQVMHVSLSIYIYTPFGQTRDGIRYNFSEDSEFLERAHRKNAVCFGKSRLIQLLQELYLQEGAVFGKQAELLHESCLSFAKHDSFQAVKYPESFFQRVKCSVKQMQYCDKAFE